MTDSTALKIVLSGPKVSEQQARNALAAARLDVQGTDHHHGLSATVSGEDTREAQAFVTVHGDDVDAAVAAVVSLGWRLRLHHAVPKPSPPSVEQMLADRLAELERRLETVEGR